MSTRLPAASLALLLLAPHALANDADEYTDAAAHLGRALVLVAANAGDAPALKIGGAALPEPVRELLSKAASHERAVDLRDLGDDELDLKGEMVPGLLDELPEGNRALEAFASDAGARLARDLAWFEGRVGQLKTASGKLLKTVQTVKSLKQARTGAKGVALQRLAAHAPLIRLRLRTAHDAPARYEALGRFFDRPTEELARSLLVLLPRVLKSASAEGAAVGDAEKLRKTAEQVAARLEALARGFEAVTDRAVEAVRNVSDQELLSVVQGKRTPTFDEVVPLVKAFRRQFGEPPALEATAAFGVFRERKTARLYFWIPGEKAWVAGSERADPLEAVQRALLDCEDPVLRREALNPKSLATVYMLFEGAEQISFSKGINSLEAGVRAAAERLEKMRAAVRAGGLTERDLDQALVRAGVASLLLEDERRLREHLLRTAIEGGQARAVELLKAVERATAALLGLDVYSYRVRLAGVASNQRVDLVWKVDGASWVQPPPLRHRVGEALSVLRVGAAGADPSDVELFAHALEGDTVKTGSAVLASGETSDVTLETSGPRLIRDGEGIQQLPKGGVPLSLDWVIGKAQRPLRPRLGGGEIRRDARDPKGTYTVRGRDAKGKVVATLSLDLPAGRGVVLGGKKRVTRVAPGTKSVAGRVRVGGATTEGQQTFQIRAAEGELLQTNPGKALDWAARVPSGRYVIDAKGALPAPLGVTQLEPHVVLSQGLFGPSVLTLAPGEGGVLRLDLWPTVVSEEILEVRWSVGDAKAVARPRPGLPGQILLLPVFASETAKPGKRSVSATVVTARGNFEVKGRFSVKAGSARVEVTLMDVDGKPAATRALALGGKRVLRAVGVRNGNWILVGPAGVRALSPRFDGQVPFELDAGESEGTYTVWLSGQRGDAPVHGVLALRAFPSHVLEVPAPTQAVVGSTITLKIPVPGDFEPPLRARVGRGAWAKGAAVRVRVQAENVLEVALSDSLGRLAQGSVSFAGRRSKQAVPAKGPRFGIVANVHERKILAADYALISSYLQNGTLPKNLAVLERGPLTAAGVRDRVLKTFPFDGPVAGNQVVYRSKRFWKTLQRSALERFEELEVPVDSVFEIQNSPSPNGEFTLRDRVAQHLAKVGAWSYELTHVRVRADGLEPHSTQAEDPKIKARLNNASISKPNGGTVGRIVVPGPLADLELVSILPKQLDLAKGNRLLFSLAAKRKKLVKNPYPNDWQLLARKARICPELEVEMTAGGKTFKAAGRSLAKSAAGVDIGIVFEHLGTKRHEDLDQKPRKAEAHSVDVQTFGEAPSPVKLDFEPLNPGLLANEPKELVIVVRARQARAVSPSAWPEERDRPKAVRIEGVPFFFEEDDVRVSSLELVITYVRTAPGGPEPPARPGPDLGDLRAGGDPKPAPSVSAALKRGRKALAKSAFEGAEAAARRAVAGAPSDPRPWTLLAEIALARELPLLAMGRARWSLGCSPTPLAWAIVGEAAYAEGDLDTASAACKAGMRLKPEAAVKKRLERLKEEVE